MSKEYEKQFVNQLQAFVQNNSPSQPAPWIGTITAVNNNLQFCNVRTKKGEVQDIPAFGIPKVGTTAIILFIDDTYSQPVAICNPINVRDDDYYELLITSSAKNYMDNGDFSREPTQYQGSYIYDNSVFSGQVQVIIKYENFSLDINETTKPKKWGNKYYIDVELLPKKAWGAIPIVATFTDISHNPLDMKQLKFIIQGEEFYATTNEEGKATYHYYPRQGFTKDGHFIVLPTKNSNISFDCTLEEGLKEYFKVQLYYQSKDSVLAMTVTDKETGEIIKSLPERIAEDTTEWKVNSDTWMVNRETYPRDNHKRIHVNLQNKGENPIRIDGILIHDESPDYDYHKSKEDILNDQRQIPI